MALGARYPDKFEGERRNSPLAPARIGGNLKNELVRHRRFASRKEVRAHTTLRYISPANYENTACWHTEAVHHRIRIGFDADSVAS
jgi:hypothetical protein